MAEALPQPDFTDFIGPIPLGADPVAEGLAVVDSVLDLVLPDGGVDPLELLEGGARRPNWPTRKVINLIRRFGEVTCDLPPEEERFYPNQARFEERAAPFILEGAPSSECPPIVMFGGIGSAGQTDWRRIAELIHAETGAHCEVYSLPGHDGSWDSLVSVRHEHWLRFVSDRRHEVLEKTGRLPLGFGLSTGANEVMIAQAEHARLNEGEPLFAGVLPVGAPIQLKNRSHAWGLKLATGPAMSHPHWERWRTMSGIVDLDVNLTRVGDDTGYVQCRFIPVITLVQMNRTRDQIGEAFTSCSVPLLAFQGGQDHLVSPAGIRKAFPTVGSTDKELVEVPEGPHSCMLGDGFDGFCEITLRWLSERYGAFADINQRFLSAASA